MKLLPLLASAPVCDRTPRLGVGGDPWIGRRNGYCPLATSINSYRILKYMIEGRFFKEECVLVKQVPYQVRKVIFGAIWRLGEAMAGLRPVHRAFSVVP